MNKTTRVQVFVYKLFFFSFFWVNMFARSMLSAYNFLLSKAAFYHFIFLTISLSCSVSSLTFGTMFFICFFCFCSSVILVSML